MLSKADNEALCRVGRGTPMGELYRRFWIPMLLSEEVGAPDGPPVRVRLLGDDLVAFRDTRGVVGLIDPYCPHRGANLYWGRNEECGIRCVYHGWKFDTTGQCVDLPNTPEGETYREKVQIRAYPTWEKAGIIWAYLGPADKEPPKPGHPWLDLPDTHRYVKRFEIECNFIQAIDGDYDPSHAFFLHSTLDGNRTNKAAAANLTTGSGVFEGITFFDSEAVETDYGLQFRTRRRTGGSTDRVGTSHFILPSFTTAGIQGIGINANNIRVPKDDYTTSWFRLRWSFEPLPEAELNEYRYGGFIYPELIPGTPTPVENKSNEYNINRHLQKTYSFTGIKAFPIQDLAVQEDQWGPLADRTQEHLVKSDEMIIRYRRQLLKLARELEAGKEPVAPWHPEAFYQTWNEVQVVPADGADTRVAADGVAAAAAAVQVGAC